MYFVLGGIAHGLGYATLTIYLCYLDYLYDLNAAKEHRESEYGKKHRKLW